MSKKKETKNILNIQQLTAEKLNEQLTSFKKELFNLRFQKKMGELKNTSRFSIVRKEIARIKTDQIRRIMLGDK